MLSVIVPVYKVEDYLKNCIQSIENQSYKDLEIILVDDGSPDKCGDICDQFAMADSRIKVVHQENGGLSAARNAGLRIATGEFITFVDSDDYIHPEMYQVLMSNLERLDADIIICDYKEVAEGENPTVDINKEAFMITEKELDNPYLMFEKKTRFVVAWNKIYKRDLFDNITYPVGKIHEDAFTTYKVLSRTEKIAYIDVPFYFYLIRGTSIMGEGFSEKRLLILDALIEEMDYFQKRNQNKILGLVYLDYRDYLIGYNNIIKQSSDLSVEILQKYVRYLNKYIFGMKGMKIPFKKRVKTYLFTISFSLSLKK